MHHANFHTASTKYSSLNILPCHIAFFYAAISLICSHLWVERLIVISINSTIIGDSSYIYSAVFRVDPLFNNFKMQHLLLIVPKGLLIDKIYKDTQRNRTYTIDLPAFKAPPGAFIAL